MLHTKKRRIVLKSKEEIELMRRAGKIVAQALDEVRRYTRPGVTTTPPPRYLKAILTIVKVRPHFRQPLRPASTRSWYTVFPAGIGY